MIAVIVKCICTDGDLTLQMRERADDEDILDYMNYITGRIGEWHQHRGCSATKLEYLKIHVSPHGMIGQK